MPEYQNRHSRDYTRQSPYNSTNYNPNNSRRTASYTSSSQRPVRNQETSSYQRRNKFSYSGDTSPSYYSKNTTPSYYSGSAAPSYYSRDTTPSCQRRTNTQRRTYQPVTHDSRPVRNSYKRQKNYEEETDINLQNIQDTSVNSPKNKSKTKKKKKTRKKKVLTTLIISLIVTLCGTSGYLYYQYKANQNKGTTEFVPFSEKLVMPKHAPKDRVVEVTLFDLDGKVYHRYELHKQRADGTYNWDKADKWD